MFRHFFAFIVFFLVFFRCFLKVSDKMKGGGGVFLSKRGQSVCSVYSMFVSDVSCFDVCVKPKPQATDMLLIALGHRGPNYLFSLESFWIHDATENLDASGPSRIHILPKLLDPRCHRGFLDVLLFGSAMIQRL